MINWTELKIVYFLNIVIYTISHFSLDPFLIFQKRKSENESNWVFSSKHMHIQTLGLGLGFAKIQTKPLTHLVQIVYRV